MADEGIFATTAEVQRKVGVNASAVSNTEAFINQYMVEAEADINSRTGIDFSAIYAAKTNKFKELLKEWSSNLAAMAVIQYDMAPIGLKEAQTRLDYLKNRADACEARVSKALTQG